MPSLPRIRVLVATTRGPVQILKIARENPSVRSVICIGGTLSALPISPAYDAFVREPTGIVERMTGYPVYRTDVSASIDIGESWQLGLFLAHAFHAAGTLASPDGPADLTVLATGGLDRDLNVTPVTHVAEKLERVGAAGKERSLYVYPDAFGHVSNVDGWEPVPVVGARNALEVCIGKVETEKLLPNQEIEVWPREGAWQWPRSFVGAAAIASASALFIAFFFGLSGSFEDKQIVRDGHEASSRPPVSMMKLLIAPRDPVNGLCLDPVIVPADRNIYEGAVCYGRMSVSDRGDYRLRMAVTGAFSSYVDPKRYKRELARSINGGDELILQIDFPYWVRVPVVLEAQAELLAMDGKPIRFAERSLEVIPSGSVDY